MINTPHVDGWVVVIGLSGLLVLIISILAWAIYEAPVDEEQKMPRSEVALYLESLLKPERYPEWAIGNYRLRHAKSGVEVDVSQDPSDFRLVLMSGDVIQLGLVLTEEERQHLHGLVRNLNYHLVVEVLENKV